ncbi:RlpA-like double-psi beta-barrel-protein domain-containing protein-containing protein [Gongronella butleri]|nr:RlpA-like double-psi beta-barrel-protein domain-containing protein-containing protein [Gongronella butleri]
MLRLSIALSTIAALMISQGQAVPVEQPRVEALEHAGYATINARWVKLPEDPTIEKRWVKLPEDPTIEKRWVKLPEDPNVDMRFVQLDPAVNDANDEIEAADPVSVTLEARGSKKSSHKKSSSKHHKKKKTSSKSKSKKKSSKSKKKSSKSKGTFKGDGTYFNPGLGSCGQTDGDHDMIAALNAPQMGYSANPNKNPNCGRYAQVKGPKGTVKVKIVDTCPPCKSGSLDLSPAAFAKIANLAAGRVPITWSWA